MIEERTTKRYQVICDGCGASGGGADYPEVARALAEESGFVHQEWHNGLDLVKRDYCRPCWKERSGNDGT